MRKDIYQNLLGIALFIGCFLTGARLYAQQKPYEGQVGYQKSQQSVIMVDLPYPPDVVEAVIRDYMGQHGWKGSSSRGYKMYHNVRLDDTTSSLNDLHIKVERKSSRDKMNSVVTVLPAGAGEDPSMRRERDAVVMGRTSAFVEKMLPVIEAGDLEDRIKTQEGVTKKEQKKLGNLHDDQTDLEKRIRNTQDDLEQNQKDHAKQAQEMKDNVKNDDNAVKKAHKKMSKLLDDQTDLQKKLVKYQAALEQNKRDQEVQRWTAGQQQQALDSLRGTRKH